MGFMADLQCPCCATMLKRKSKHHCKSCWDKFHNGLKDNDWLSWDEWVEKGEDKYDEEFFKRYFKDIEAILAEHDEKIKYKSKRQQKEYYKNRYREGESYGPE